MSCKYAESGTQKKIKTKFLRLTEFFLECKIIYVPRSFYEVRRSRHFLKKWFEIINKEIKTFFLFSNFDKILEAICIFK